MENIENMRRRVFEISNPDAAEQIRFEPDLLPRTYIVPEQTRANAIKPRAPFIIYVRWFLTDPHIPNNNIPTHVYLFYYR